MIQKTISSQSLTTAPNLNIEYYDDDIIILDNVKDLSIPFKSRFDMNIVTFVIEGKSQIHIDGHLTQLTKNQLLICPPNRILSDLMVSPDFVFKTYFFTNRILQNLLHEKIGIWNEMMYINRMYVTTLDPKTILILSHIYDLLNLCEEAKEGTVYHSEIKISLLRSAFLKICSLLKTETPPEQPRMSKQSDIIFHRFLKLLDSSSNKHKSVMSYANELCVSPKYLSVICKNNSGKTANEWITDHVLEDIRYHLKHTDLSIKQICERVGFANTSFFGKYVKQHFGMTPAQLRRAAT